MINTDLDFFDLCDSPEVLDIYVALDNIGSADKFVRARAKLLGMSDTSAKIIDDGDTYAVLPSYTSGGYPRRMHLLT